MAGDPTELSVQEHADGLAALRPQGLIWTTTPGTNARLVLEGLATEIARVTGRAVDLVNEADPRTTAELIVDWERMLGLPAPCEPVGGVPPLLALRQFAVTAKLVQSGGQTAQAFIDLAAFLGFVITVTDYTRFRVSQDAVGKGLYGEEWVWAWTATAPEHGGQFFAVGSGQVGDALFEEGTGVLECFLEFNQPAHATLDFQTTGLWSGWAPWRTIYPDPAVLELVSTSVVLDVPL